MVKTCVSEEDQVPAVAPDYDLSIHLGQWEHLGTNKDN